MDANHGLIFKEIEAEVNNNFKSPLENQLAKKRFVVNASVILKSFGAINPYKKIMCTKRILWRIWVY